jgi:hypothetical protein
MLLLSTIRLLATIRPAIKPLALFTAAAASASLGCSGQLNLGDRPDGGDAGVELGDGGACTGTPTDLRGTWDLIGAGPGEMPATGVLVLGDNALSVAFGSTSLTFTGTGNPVVWTDDIHGTVTIRASQVASTVDTGVLPLNLGGAWSFTSGTSGCNASLSAGGFNASCDDGVVGLPEPLPNLAGTMNMTKTSSLPSIFGALGGVWSASFVDGTCTATLSGNTMTVDCANESAFDGSVQLSICQGAISGSTSHGVAFTGRRQ